MFSGNRTNDIFAPGFERDFSKPTPSSRPRDQQSAQGSANYEHDFKKLLDDSVRMNQQYFRRAAALESQPALEPMQNSAKFGGTNLLAAGFVGGFQQTGRTIEQLYEALQNDVAAKRSDHISTTESAQARQWMVNKGLPVSEFERDMKQLRACQKLISDDRQAQLAPGAKFGRLGGNRALNNANFLEQVYESGSSNNQVKIGQRLEKSYYGKLLAKVKKASKLLIVNEDIDSLQLMMPPTREIQVQKANQKEKFTALDPSESSFLAQGRPRPDRFEDQGAVKSDLVYSDRAKDIIQRAQRGMPMSDQYDISYFDEIIKTQSRLFPKSPFNQERQKASFLNYTRFLMLFAEGKYFSNRVDIAQMARRLAQYEQDEASRLTDEAIHWDLHDIWAMIETLDGAIPAGQRPTQVQILTSLGDQRKPVHGTVAKDSLDCRIAAVSCLNLEKLYLSEMIPTNRIVDTQQKLEIFVHKTTQIVNKFEESNKNIISELSDCLISDQTSKQYPYLTILLLFRAGLHQEAIMFANKSNLDDVRIFGDEIYQKCIVVFGGRLPQNEIANFMGHAQSTAPGQYDVCRDALVHLMTGCSFSQEQYSEFLFKYVLEDNINNWLWFHLKLASFQFGVSQSNLSNIIDYRSRSLPSNYKAYFLEDLVQKVTDDTFKNRVHDADLDDATNKVKFARILFYIGEFQYGINELLVSQHHVEATVIGVAMTELSLLATKHGIFKTVSDQNPKTKQELQHFSVDDLAVLYERSFDLDSHLLALAFGNCNQQNYLTEAFTLISMVEFEPLMQIGMIEFIRKNGLIEMLIEAEIKYTLNFEINKDLSLRQFIGADQFKKLIRRMVEIVADQDPETCICLLDKINETKAVLQTMITLQSSQIQKNKPLRFVSPTDSTHDHDSQYRVFDSEQQLKRSERVAQTFKTMLSNYKKEGIDRKFPDLFQVIEQLDLVQEAFEPISKQEVTMESLTQSINRLLQLQFLPSFKGLNANYRADDLERIAQSFPDLDPALQEATLDCVIAISKISMHLKHAICSQSEVIMYEKNAKAQKIRDDIKARKDYQEYLTSYIDVLASMTMDVRMSKYEERLTKYAMAMRAIYLEMT